MTGRGEVIAWRERVTVAVLELLTAERRLSDESASMADLAAAERALDLAARDLTSAIDELPPRDRPKGWERDADGRTA